MSYSSNRRDALDATMPFAHRASHARSCAMLLAQKFRVPRDLVLDLVGELSGIDMHAMQTDEDIATAISLLESLRFSGLGSAFR